MGHKAELRWGDRRFPTLLAGEEVAAAVGGGRERAHSQPGTGRPEGARNAWDPGPVPHCTARCREGQGNWPWRGCQGGSQLCRGGWQEAPEGAGAFPWVGTAPAPRPACPGRRGCSLPCTKARELCRPGQHVVKVRTLASEPRQGLAGPDPGLQGSCSGEGAALEDRPLPLLLSP